MLILATIFRGAMESSLDWDDSKKKFRFSCTDALNDFSYCHSPANQFRYYYRYGTVEDCEQQWKDFKFCLAMKFKKPEIAEVLFSQRKQELLDSGVIGKSFWDPRSASEKDSIKSIPS